MDRRNFLKSMGALAAAAACMPSFAAITEPNKYAESLRLLDACRGITDTRAATEKVDQLLVYLRLNFTPPENTEANYDACALLLQTSHDHLESIARGIPPDIADGLYPIALFRLGLASYRIEFDPGRSNEFNWFHKTYGKVVIQGADAKRKPGYQDPNRPNFDKPRTAEQVQNDNLTWVNRQADPLKWSPTWEEDMKLFNIKGQA
jgi:hypothetical protein